MKTSSVLCIAFLFLSACMSRDETLPGETMAAFEKAFNSDDADAFVALMTEDAQIIPDRGPVISGRENVREFLKDLMTPVTLFNTDTSMSIVRRDLGVEQGQYIVRDIRKGADVELGNYLHVWRKQDGQWRLHRIMYSTTMAPPGEVSIDPAT